MSAPLFYGNPLQGALIECLSAMSALNMDPSPIPGAIGYLSETDAWAKHAMEHLQTAIALINKVLR